MEIGKGRIRRVLRLPQEEEHTDTYREIEDGVYFRGHNFWLLVLAMGIASIGLNMNSPAAVIGAMLISPLMGPVVGLSFGLSIQDRGLVRLSLWHWGVMILTSISASTLYFLISPFHAETGQLSSFKEATIFDCLLALLGGIAWFLGIIRKEAIKVIAGVAVATACIPPLCTAGYGLANLNWDYFWGGLYFYLINCFFIGVATWMCSLLLGYKKYYLSQQINQPRMLAWVSVLSILILIPSVWITWNKWQDQRLEQKGRLYVEKITARHPDLSVLQWKTRREEGKNILRLDLGNDSVSVQGWKLEDSDALDPDIHLEWHYAEGNFRDKQILQLQKQIDLLRAELKALRTQN